ncbi:MAG: GHKL domain-containing protein [Candidatus Marinimicrobia bacterium]|nr:GHKL domain-containing protein [Candidatus Neomarinimicrobiota bacterium]
MKKIIPSFQIQILFLFIVLLLFSVFFTRTYYSDSVKNYLNSESDIELESGIIKAFEDYQKSLPDSLQDKFAGDMEYFLKIVKDQQLKKDFFLVEFETYSGFIAGFAVIFGLMVFILSFSLISKPLKKLEKANIELGKGNFSIRVKESRFSPLNELLVSFNQMATEIEENRRLLLEAEKKMIWREIARAMAHEIKNPLTPIKLSLERMELKYYQNPESFHDIFQSATKIINEEVDNLEKLVNRFRGFAAIPEPEKVGYDLVEQLTKCIKPYRDKINIAFHSNLPYQKILADEQQIRQVFSNLILNAIQAMTEKGNIEINLTGKEAFAVITISDDGTGIEKENLDKIFEPYFTTKRKGTGLGLALVRQIVENHQGGISVESEVGKGTLFQIKLPLS